MSNNVFNIVDPYPFYEEKHKQQPVYRGDCGTWYVTRYHDVKMLLSDNRFSRRPLGDHGVIHQQTEKGVIDKIIDKWPIYSDPPDHPKIRLLLTEVFNPQQIKMHKDTAAHLCDELLVNLLKHESVDFIEHFAFPLPLRMINHLLGTSIDKLTSRKWSLCLGHALDSGSPEDIKKVACELQIIHDYFSDLIQFYTHKPADNWISRLIPQLKAHSFSDEDLVSICIFLFVSAVETTQLALGTGILSLLKNPEQLHLLVADPECVPQAVEEILRYESPVSKLSRWTNQRVTICNISIPENELIVGLINAANRDPERFIEPNKFDIKRTNNRHLALSYGSHSCQGGILARIELQTALRKLLPHLTRFKLVDNGIEWLPNTSLRYLFQLLIDIQP